MLLLCCVLNLAPALPPGRQGATCIAISPVAGVIAVGGHGGLDLHVDGERVPLGDSRNVFAICWQDGMLLEAGGRAGEAGKVQCWDWRARKLLWSADEHEDIACSIAAGAGRVFTGSGDKSIAVREIESGKRLQYLAGHAGAVLALAASPDGKFLASAGTDRSIRIWSLESLMLVRAINNHGDSVNALAWSPDGKFLASGSSDRTVRVWQPGVGRLVRIVRGHDASVLSLAFTEKHIVSGAADGKVRLIDASSDAILKVLEGHTDWVCGVAAGKEALASADWTGKVLLWKDGVAAEIR